VILRSYVRVPHAGELHFPTTLTTPTPVVAAGAGPGPSVCDAGTDVAHPAARIAPSAIPPKLRIIDPLLPQVRIMLPSP
jgi:hypothetical protein